MDEFKRVHRKMFAHSTVTEDDGSTCFHSEETQLKISHTLEVSQSFLISQRKLDKFYCGHPISNIHTCGQVDGHNISNIQSHHVTCARLKHKLQL